MGETAAVHAYLIGLDALMRHLVAADLPRARIHRLRRLRGGAQVRRGPRPDLVVIDLTATDAAAEREAVVRAWGTGVVIVGLDRRSPMARVWRPGRPPELVELAPGLFPSLLPELPEGSVRGAAGAESADGESGQLFRYGRLIAYLTAYLVLVRAHHTVAATALLYLALVLPPAALARHRFSLVRSGGGAALCYGAQPSGTDTGANDRTNDTG